MESDDSGQGLGPVTLMDPTKVGVPATRGAVHITASEPSDHGWTVATPQASAWGVFLFKKPEKKEEKTANSLFIDECTARPFERCIFGGEGLARPSAWSSGHWALPTPRQETVMTSATSVRILKTKAQLMQQMLDYARYGYDKFTSGSVDTEKLAHFSRKMELAYYIDLDKYGRSRRKKVGLGNAVLLLYCPGTMDQVDWWLLVSPGSHPATTAEKLEPISQLRVFGFHQVMHTRRGKAKPVATWAMTRERYEQSREILREVVRSKDPHRMAVLLAELYRMPGFAGIRTQIGKLAVLYQAEVKRQSLVNAPQPPKRLGYVRRLKITGQSVRQFMAELETQST